MANFDDNPQVGELLAKVKAIDWFQFEILIGLLYEDAGYSVQRVGGAKADGGVDLIAEKPGKRAVVQCKHWNSWKVPPKDIRELLGAMADTGVQYGVCVTMRGFSKEAQDLAARQGIVLYQETDIVGMIMSADSVCAPRIATLLNDTRKFCPECETEMVVRTAKKGKKAGSQFWGCPNFRLKPPRCRTTFDIPDSMKPGLERKPESVEQRDDALKGIESLLLALMQKR